MKPHVFCILALLVSFVSFSQLSDDNVKELVQATTESKPFVLRMQPFVKNVKSSLDKFVKVLIDNPTLKIEYGLCEDCRVPIINNDDISTRREKFPIASIKSRIPNTPRIFRSDYGEIKQANKGECEVDIKSFCSFEDHPLNRRTECRIVKKNDKRTVNYRTFFFTLRSN